MKVDIVLDEFGMRPDDGPYSGDGPFELTGEALLAIFSSGRDVILTHRKQPQPTRKQRKAGAPDVPPLVILYTDRAGGMLRQR